MKAPRRHCFHLLPTFLLPLLAVQPATAEEITLDQAETAVGNWIARGGGFGKLSSGTEVSGRTLEDPETGARMHVVNVPGKGFVVTSADDGIEPIVMFSDDVGVKFVAEQGNPVWDLLRWDLAARAEALAEVKGAASDRNASTPKAAAKSGGAADSPTPGEKWAALLGVSSISQKKASGSGKSEISDIRVDQLVKTKWGQDDVNNMPAYNYYTPGKINVTEVPAQQKSSYLGFRTGECVNLVTNESGHYPCGCVATAGAQLMKKWGQPSSPRVLKNATIYVDGKKQERDMKGGPYQWGDMGGERPLSEFEREAVGRVTFDIGVACGAKYAQRGTSMTTATLVEKLRTVFGYKSAEWKREGFLNFFFNINPGGVSNLEKLAIPNFNAGAPMLLAIQRSRDDESINHCVVADGYGYDNGNFSMHINFGWNGGGNAWYVPPDLNTGMVDNSGKRLNYGFVYGVGYNISPYGSGAFVSGRATGPNGRPIEGATVQLCSASGAVISTTSTGKNGSYWFQQEPGDYAVSIRLGNESNSQTISLPEGDNNTIENELQDWTISSAPSVADISSSVASAKASARGSDPFTISAPVSVLLSCVTRNAEIHYTLDGSQPRPESPVFDGPITIQDTTTLRAVAYAAGMECSETFERTWTYVDPVSRDAFANARTLAGTSGSSSFSNVGYTREDGEPIHSSAGSSGGASAWASWTAPSTGDWTFRLESAGDNAQGTTPNPQLAVYIGSSVDALTLVAANDDICPDRWNDAYDVSSMVAFSASAGETYKIAMDTRYGSYGDSYVGDLRLSWAEGFTHWARLDYCSLFAPGPGATASVGVESSAVWCVVECSDWIIPDSATGTNRQPLAFSVLPNETGADRYGSISIQSGNSDIATVSVRQHVMDFVMTREEAVEAAWRENKRILLVRGREVCPNTSGTLFSSIPSSAVRPLVEAGYVLWYSNCDRQRDANAYSAGGSLPTVAILDPQNMSASAPATSGYQSPGELRSFLETNASWDGLPSPTEVTLSGVGTVMSATPFSMTATFADGTVLDMKHGATWSIASGSAATISKTGVLTPVSGKTGTVTVSGSVVLRGKTYTRTKSVRIVDPATVTGISLVGPDTIDLYDEVSGHFTATATFRDGTTAVIAPNWTIEETAVTNAVISSDGLVTFPNPEKYTKASRLKVTAECNGVSASKEADVWGWSVTLSSWTTPQRVVWPGQTIRIVPQSVTWWRHGMTEEPTTDLSNVDFGIEHGWLNGNTLLSAANATSGEDGLTQKIPTEVSEPEGDCSFYVTTAATRFGHAVTKVEWTEFKYLPSAPSQTVDVTFVADGGEPATQTTMYAVGYTYGFFPDAARKGYHCTWYTAALGGRLITGSSNCLASVTRLYARWLPNSYYVSYNANGGTGSMYGHNFYYDTPANLRPNAFSKPGSVFAGWATAPDGEVVFEDEADILNLYDSYHSLTLYASWVENGYKIAFDANGGVGTMPSQICRVGTCSSLESATFTRRGATFAGWSRTPDGAAEFSDRAEVCDLTTTVGATMTLYAVWRLPDVASIEVSGPDAIDLYDVDSAQFSATCRLADGRVVNVAPRWSVEETAVTNAVISHDGLVSFPSPEKYTKASRLRVTAECNGVRASRTVNVWGWSATIHAWTMPQRTLWPGQTVRVVPKSIVWWRHGVTEEPTADFSGISFQFYGYVHDTQWHYLNGGETTSIGELAITIPLDIESKDGYGYMNVQALAERRGAVVSKGISGYFNCLSAAPAQMLSVTFDANGGDPASQTSLYAIDKPYGYLPTLASRTGYYSPDWYTAKEGGTRMTTASNCVASVTRLYARWSPRYYYINYDANGGTGSMYGQYFYYDAPDNLRANAFTKIGHAFGGWSMEPGGGAVFEDKAAILNLASVYTNILLYAVWTPATYTVTLNAQNGTGGSATATATYEAAMPAITVPTRTGYTFGGYYTAANGGGTQYYTAAGASARVWDRTVATTLYAKWTAITCEVAFDRQSGTGGTASATATYGSAMPSITVPTRTGYTFGGYYTAANGVGTRYYAASGTSARDWDKTSATTLYAKWTANAYTVTFDRQSGSGGSASVSATFGSAMPSITAPTRTGYTFGGYYTAANGGGTQYYTASGSSARTWDKAAATTLYAKWTANAYVVTLDRQSGSGGSASVSATFGSAMPAITVPTRIGYTFGGYYTAANGGGTQYYTAAGTSARAWNKAADTTLYAKWTANAYAVTFDRQSGTGGSASVSATFGSSMPAITVPTRTGYAFGGYYTVANGGGTQYYTAAGASARTWDRTAATTLYAKWTANAYTVTFDRQSGSGGSASVSATFGSAMPAITVPTRTGYTFGGYYTAANGGGAQYYAASGASARTWDRATATTLYAKWIARTYDVTLDSQGGEGGSATVTATYGSALPDIGVPVLDGLFFAGYWTEPDGEGVQYYTASGTSARNWDLAAGTTLYAQWIESVPLAVHRFYSANYKGHFFTIDETEKDGLIAGNRNWNYEGVAYRAFTEKASGTVALYRFYSKNYRGHFFTINEEEAETIKRTNKKNWDYEGVAYYVYPSAVEGSVPVFRFWSDRFRHHFYTIDEAEKDGIIARDRNWTYEGVAFWALPEEGGGQQAMTKKSAKTASVTQATAAWSLSALPGGETIETRGVTEVGGTLVETRGEVPDAEELEHAEFAEFEAHAEDAENAEIAARLALPPGVWNAMLWSAEEGVVADETAEGAFDFDLPANGVWHWLRVRAAEDEDAEDAYSLWLRAE